MKYLHDKQYYIDRYDKITVERLRWFENNVLKNKSLDRQSRALAESFSKLIIYYHAGNAYVNKESTIQKWMDNDKERDRVYESAREPTGIQCRCGRIMHSTYKTLHEDNQVIFFFDCPKGCLPKRAIFDNGEEWTSKKYQCPQCNTKLQEETTRDGDKIATIYNCNSCKYSNTDIIELSSQKEEVIDPDYEKDRARFCISDKDGIEFIQHAQLLKEIEKIKKERKEKEEKKELYEKVEKMNKLSIPQIKDFFIQSLEETNYINPVFEKPEISNIVSISFSVEDKSNTGEYDSKQNLKKHIRTALENTNWRLMSEGISYRLGLLSGCIRAYENEKDLVKLIEKSKK
jgi:hypothetical protein